MSLYLWISVAVFVLSYIFKERKNVFCILNASGWILFSLHWFKTVFRYFNVSDYVNTTLVILAFITCIFMAFFLLRHIKKTDDSEDMKIYHTLMKAVIVVGIVYFPFNAVEPLKDILIGFVAYLTCLILNLLGFVSILEPGYTNVITHNTKTVQIVLGCTAIESIALFSGLVLSTNIPKIKKALYALFFSITIFILNLFRNVFVIAAYGNQWFGENSFVISHHYIAKAGSLITLILLAYLLFRLMPEIFEFFEKLINLLKKEIEETLKLSN
ncbi:MAG: archaeosortase A [Methanosarcinaceae archaeon]|nr:archaeosortase A [Methanosarcinaceae archaeon]